MDEPGSAAETAEPNEPNEAAEPESVAETQSDLPVESGTGTEAEAEAQAETEQATGTAENAENAEKEGAQTEVEAEAETDEERETTESAEQTAENSEKDEERETTESAEQTAENSEKDEERESAEQTAENSEKDEEGEAAEDTEQEEVEPEPAAEAPVLEPAAGMLFSFTIGAVLVSLLCVVSAIVASLAAPKVGGVYAEGNEDAAVEALKAIAASQKRYQAEDLDQNGRRDFAGLNQLGASGLLDPDLASGLKNGYVFEVAASEVDPDKKWMATATPVLWGRTGRRHFAINHTGAVWYRRRVPIQIDRRGCEMPPDVNPMFRRRRRRR